MSRIRPRQTFADIVREVAAPKPAPLPEPRGPGFTPEGWLVDQAGRQYVRVAADISAARALLIAREGAVIVWDSCGCGGYCPLTWFAGDDVSRLVAAGTPRIRRTKSKHGLASEWHTDDGRALVLLERDVEWADLMS
jgi:hypothetical protein